MEPLLAFLTGVIVAGVAAGLICKRLGGRRRSAEERARRAEELLRQVENRADAAELAGGLIHEIKNPLNSLSMNLQLLAEDWAAAATQEERRALKRIERLQTETSRLAAILDEFTDFVRQRKLAMTPCDVNSILDDVVTFVRPELAANDIEIRTSYGELPKCAIDLNLFKQALLNLLLNAEAAVAASPMREIIIRTACKDHLVRIDIIDTGKGIMPDDVEKIFKAFYSTRKNGTGLGLSTTRRIVEEHGGTISVHSDHGHGTCFTITLPPAPATDAPSQQVGAAPYHPGEE